MTNLKINLFKIIRKEYLGKSQLTSGNAYKITLRYNNKNNITFIFNDNIKNDSCIYDYIYSIILDARSYEFTYNFVDFCNEFGFDSDSIKSLKCYNVCKKMYNKLNKIGLNLEEIEKELNELGY